MTPIPRAGDPRGQEVTILLTDVEFMQAAQFCLRLALESACTERLSSCTTCPKLAKLNHGRLNSTASKAQVSGAQRTSTMRWVQCIWGSAFATWTRME